MSGTMNTSCLCTDSVMWRIFIVVGWLRGYVPSLPLVRLRLGVTDMSLDWFLVFFFTYSLLFYRGRDDLIFFLPLRFLTEGLCSESSFCFIYVFTSHIYIYLSFKNKEMKIYFFLLVLILIIINVLDRSEDQSHANTWHNLHRLKAPRMRKHTRLNAPWHTIALRFFFF